VKEAGATREKMGDIPLPLGAPGLHAITVHIFSRQITELKNNEIKC